jgi:hypothetical protein
MVCSSLKPQDEERRSVEEDLLENHKSLSETGI